MAARVKVTAKVAGLREVQTRLTDPQALNEPLKDLLTEGASIGHKAAKEALDGGTGKAVRALNQWVNPTFSRVTSAMPKARTKSIDKGRKRGGPMPPEGQITRWMQAEGLPTDRGSVWKMRRLIKAQGVPGKEFLKQSRTAVADAMPRLRRDLDRKLEGKYRR
jgi:hypothetical protein